jgi:hypothetical protein
MITAVCQCGRSSRVSDEYAGRRARCKTCGNVLTVPDKPGPESLFEVVPETSLEIRIRDEPQSGRRAGDPKRVGPLGIASFIFAVICLAACWVPVLNLIVIPLSAIAVILGVIDVLTGLLADHGKTVVWGVFGVLVACASYYVGFRVNERLVAGMRQAGNELHQIMRAR